MTVELGPITAHKGIAGQVAYSVDVTYDDEPPQHIRFVGSIYGGPVVMQTPALDEGVFVTDPSRFGSFSPDWVNRFFAE